jgi:hypothetical protein
MGSFGGPKVFEIWGDGFVGLEEEALPLYRGQRKNPMLTRR